MTPIGWEDALEAFYGSQISDKQVPVWEHYLREDNTNSAELVKAIEMAAESEMKPAEWRVTVRDLRKWLKIYRSRQCASNRSADTEAKRSAFVDHWREKLNRGADQQDFISAAELFSAGIKDFNELCREVLAE